MSVQVAAMLLPFLLQPISYNTPSSKVSLKSLGLSLSRLELVDRKKALAIFAVMQSPTHVWTDAASAGDQEEVY